LVDLPKKPLEISDEKLGKLQKSVTKEIDKGRKEYDRYIERWKKRLMKHGMTEEEAMKEIVFIENY